MTVSIFGFLKYYWFNIQNVIERVAESIIREQVYINGMQFGFVPGRGTTDAIFILRQMQEKYVGADKRLYMAFVDLEKAFEKVSIKDRFSAPCCLSLSWRPCPENSAQDARGSFCTRTSL